MTKKGSKQVEKPKSSEPKEQDVYLTFTEVRGMLKISDSKLWQMRHSGLPVVILHGTKRIVLADLRAYIAERKHL